MPGISFSIYNYCSDNNTNHVIFTDALSYFSHKISNYDTTQFTTPPGKMFSVWQIFSVTDGGNTSLNYKVGDKFTAGENLLIEGSYTGVTIQYYLYPIYVDAAPTTPPLPYIAPNRYIPTTNQISIPFSSTVPVVPRMNVTLFSNNSLILYKTNSLPTSGAGSVRNSRSVGRRT
jgi:hypothetical protein